MDWKQQAKIVFNVSKPAYFTTYTHCCECAEHDDTLRAYDRDSIGLPQLGHPSWDPLCFSSAEGLLYYLPVLVGLTLETMENPHEMYLEQLLFHLLHDGKDNRLLTVSSPEQREFIAGFLGYLIESHSARIAAGVFYAEDILKAYELWSAV